MPIQSGGQRMQPEVRAKTRALIPGAFVQESLHGMAGAWPEVLGTARMKSLDHEALMHQLLKAESAYRDVRSMAYQMRAARFPAHRDLTGFAFDESQVDEALVRELHKMKFIESAHNVVFVGGHPPLPYRGDRQSKLEIQKFQCSGQSHNPIQNEERSP